jgi:hypothetical protein
VGNLLKVISRVAARKHGNKAYSGPLGSFRIDEVISYVKHCGRIDAQTSHGQQQSLWIRFTLANVVGTDNDVKEFNKIISLQNVADAIV